MTVEGAVEILDRRMARSPAVALAAVVLVILAVRVRKLQLWRIEVWFGDGDGKAPDATRRPKRSPGAVERLPADRAPRRLPQH
jgi:hypothetical protein